MLMHLLAGDIGGTKTWLALYEYQDGDFQCREQSKYRSADFHGLAPMLRVFLGEKVQHIRHAAFGVAGPVVNNSCKATNLPWRIEGEALQRELGIQCVHLMNDFDAIAWGIDSLGHDDVCILQEAPTVPNAPQAIIGAGTGLGEAIVVPMPSGEKRVLSSEGGHVDFAARNDEEIDLLRFLLKRHARVSYERVVSGPGLVTLYEFIVASGRAATTDIVRKRMANEDAGAVIGACALEGSDEACVRAARLFVSLYGAEAGNLALTCLPRGGLFIAGGIAAKLLPLMQAGPFMESFKHKGRMSPLLDSIPITLIRDSQVGLLGARNKAWQLSQHP